ncbi:hypothetical protein [Sphingomonas melonis]|uniref:Uncharacterized protein n=1 Tax=Sphingomonas melonis TaxID=152682 RepID=A0A7Y9JZ30_9SPHN|nr:hypothetical protein [Sphingomonas melonis]NYD88413.1 hypothetical protein [Sphingomonas melonis]
MSVGYGPGDGSYHGVRTDTSRHSTRRNTPSRSRNQPSNPITDIVAGQRSAAKALHTVAKAEFDFASGVSDGAYDTAKGSAKAALAFVKNPVSATQNNNFALAGLIDRAIAAEDTPASIQLARAANRIRHTNPHEIGYVTGSVTAGVAIGRVTGMAASKISALRQARLPQRLRPDCAPVKYKWVKENLKAGPAKDYNDAAPNARPGYAPAPPRTMPVGKQRLVKFDGFQADWPVDRTFGVTSKPRSVAQVLRQSQALREHKLIGLWDFPNARQKSLALKLLKKADVHNIKVRSVKS